MRIFNALPDFRRQRLTADHHFLVVQAKQHGMDLLFAGGNDINKGYGVDHHHVLPAAHGRHLMIEAKIVN
ncbi:Uncharacterised protein [Klebsiella pneumoniae]|uniref:Uncharacterized protein n=1 Tax=Klebsiella pneumoniae TaxID=573 RepID=A0A447S1H9_KLEPN|nr:Uncharacterised protein [Klebsiella pneumoniae]